jgi:hypothetical protein
MRQVDFTTLFHRADQRLAEPASEAIPTTALGGNRQKSRAVVAIPKRCDLAMLGLAVLSFSGALSLSYYCLTGLDKTAWHPTSLDTPVYDARAVPRDEHQEQAARRRGSNSSKLQQPQNSRGEERYNAGQPRRTAVISPGSGARQTFSFPELDWNLRAQSFGLATSIVGPTSQSNSSGQFAPNAAFGAVAPVPEPSLWNMSGAAAALLIVLERLRPARRQH